MTNWWEWEPAEDYRQQERQPPAPPPQPAYAPPAPQPAPQPPRGLPQWASSLFAGGMGMLEDLLAGRTTAPQLQAQQQQQLAGIREEPRVSPLTGLLPEQMPFAGLPGPPMPQQQPLVDVGAPIQAWARAAAAYPRGQEALANVEQLFEPLSAVARGAAGATRGLLTGQGPTWEERQERFERSPLGTLWSVVRDREAVTDPVNLFRDSFADLPGTLQEDYERWVAIEEEAPLLWRIPAEILFDPTVFVPLAMGAFGVAVPRLTKAISAVRKVRYGIAAATAEPEELALMVATYGAFKGASWLVGKASEQLRLRKLFLWAGQDAPQSAYEDMDLQADGIVDELRRQGVSTTREEILAASRQVLFGESPVAGINPQVQTSIDDAARGALRFYLNLNLGSLQALGEIDPEMGWAKRQLLKWTTGKVAGRAIGGVPGAAPGAAPPGPPALPQDVTDAIVREMGESYTVPATIGGLAQWSAEQTAAGGRLQEIWQRMKDIRHGGLGDLLRGEAGAVTLEPEAEGQSIRAAIEEARVAGQTIRTRDLAQRLGIDPYRLTTLLTGMQGEGLVTPQEGGIWVPTLEGKPIAGVEFEPEAPKPEWIGGVRYDRAADKYVVEADRLEPAQRLADSLESRVANARYELTRRHSEANYRRFQDTADRAERDARDVREQIARVEAAPAEPAEPMEFAMPAEVAPAAPVTPPRKEPWEMTRAELHELAKTEEPMLRRWRNLQKRGRGRQRGGAFVNVPRRLQPWTDAWSRHQGLVMRALSEGKPVPPEVLADYPDLAMPTEIVEPAPPEVAPTLATLLDKAEQKRKPIWTSRGAQSPEVEGYRLLREMEGRGEATRVAKGFSWQGDRGRLTIVNRGTEDAPDVQVLFGRAREAAPEPPPLELRPEAVEQTARPVQPDFLTPEERRPVLGAEGLPRRAPEAPPEAMRPMEVPPEEAARREREAAEVAGQRRLEAEAPVVPPEAPAVAEPVVPALTDEQRGEIDAEQRHRGGYTYCTDCTVATAEAIDAMTEGAEEISYATFAENVNEGDLDALAEGLGYVTSGKGMRLQDDSYPRYYRSEYEGRPAYYLEHSLIEHVFAADQTTEAYKAELGIEEEPPRAAEPVTPEAVAPELLPAPSERPSKTTIARGADPTDEYEMRFRLVELDDLIASQTETLADNPDYPSKMQPRIRDRKAARLQVQGIAQKPSYGELLEDTHTLSRGVPIIGPDLIVEGGNGRVLGLRKMREEFPANFKEYQAELRRRLVDYEIDPAEAEGFTAPVLVRERTTPLPDMQAREEFARKANRRDTLGMSPFETAQQDAELVTDEMVSGLTVGENDTIDGALKRADNRPFVRRFLQLLPPNEQATLVGADGSLNRLGLGRIKAALLAKTYPGEAGKRLVARFTESMEPGIKRIETGVLASLPDMSRAESLMRRGIKDPKLSIGNDLSLVVDMLARLRNEKMRVADYLAQAPMFRPTLSKFQKSLLEYVDEISKSGARARDFLRTYAQGVQNSPTIGQVGMLGVTAPTKGDLLEQVADRLEAEGRARAPTLFEAAEAAQAEVAAVAPEAREELERGPLEEAPLLALEGEAARKRRAGEELESIRADVQLMKDEADHLRAIRTAGSPVLVRVPESDFPELREGVLGTVVKPGQWQRDMVGVEHELEGRTGLRFYSGHDIRPVWREGPIPKFPEPPEVAEARIRRTPMERVRVTDDIARLRTEASRATDPMDRVFSKKMLENALEAKRRGVEEFVRPVSRQPERGYDRVKIEGVSYDVPRAMRAEDMREAIKRGQVQEVPVEEEAELPPELAMPPTAPPIEPPPSPGPPSPEEAPGVAAPPAEPPSPVVQAVEQLQQAVQQLAGALTAAPGEEPVLEKAVVPTGPGPIRGSFEQVREQVSLWATGRGHAISGADLDRETVDHILMARVAQASPENVIGQTAQMIQSGTPGTDVVGTTTSGYEYNLDALRQAVETQWPGNLEAITGQPSIPSARPIPTEAPPPAPSIGGQPPLIPPEEPPGVDVQRRLPEEPPDESQWRLIRRARQEAEGKPPLVDRVKSLTAKAMLTWIDRFDPVKRLSLKAYNQFALLGGTQKRAQSLLEQHFWPNLRRAQEHWDEFWDYMVARRMPDLIANAEEIGVEAKLPAGVTDPEAAIAAMESELGSEVMTTFNEVGEDFWANNRRLMVDYAVSTHLLSQAGADAMKARHPHWVPYYRQGFDAIQDLASESVGRKGTRTPRAFSKRMKQEGSLRRIKDPFQSFVESFMNLYRQGANNMAVRSMVRTLRMADPAMVQEGDRTRTGWGVAKFREQGKTVTVTVPEAYARIAESLDGYNMGIIGELFRRLSRPLIVGAVRFNPTFIVRNAVKDAMRAWVTEGLVPLSPTWIQGMADAFTHSETWHEAAQAGALGGGYSEIAGRPGPLRRLGPLPGMPGRRPIGIALVAKKAADLPWLIARVNEAVEEGTRAGLWRKLGQRGVLEEERGVRTQAGTTNFWLGGFATRVLNNLSPFLSARVGGVRDTLAAIRRNPRKALLRLLPLVIPSVIFYLLGKRVESADKIPDYEYFSNYILPIGEGTKEPDPRYPEKPPETYPIYLKIPKSEIVTLVTAVPEALLRMGSYIDDGGPAEIALRAAFQGLVEMSPVDVPALLPPVTGTAAQVAMNRDIFRRRDIVPQGEEGRPPEAQFGPETSKVAIALGRQFGISPRYIDFAIGDVAAGGGRALTWLSDLGLGAIGYEPAVPGMARRQELSVIEKVAQAPVVRALVGTRATQPYRRGYKTLDKAVDEARESLYRNPEVRRFGLGVAAPGSSITIDGVPHEVTPEQRAQIVELTTPRVDRAWQELVSRDWYEDMDDTQRHRMLIKVRSKIQSNVRAHVLSDVTGDPTRVYGQGEMGQLIDAYELYEQYETIPSYLGMTAEEEDLVRQATSTISSWARAYPSMPTEMLRNIYAQQDPMGAYLHSIRGRAENPQRRAFWAANPLLSRYFGGVSAEEMQALSGFAPYVPYSRASVTGMWAQNAMMAAQPATERWAQAAISTMTFPAV